MKRSSTPRRPPVGASRQERRRQYFHWQAGAGRPLKTLGNFLMLAERWMSPTALKAAFKTSKRISPKRNPHFSPGRWWHDEKQFIFSTLIGSI